MPLEAKMKCTFTVVALFLCFSGYAYSQNMSDDVLQRAEDAIGGNIPELRNLNTSEVEARAETLFREKCTKNGGPDAYENAERAKTEMIQCGRSLINITDLEAEIEKYKTTGDLDIVFKRYCNKRSILRACVTNFTDAIENCLDEEEKESKKIVLNITDSLLDFTCFKEGERIALFIAAGGPECIESKKEVIQDCVNKTYASNLPKDGILGIENLPLLVFTVKECRNMVSLQTCIVAELETCQDPTTANLVNSIFNYVKRVTPCENLLSAAQSAAATDTRDKSGVARASGAFLTVAILSVVASCYRIFVAATV